MKRISIFALLVFLGLVACLAAGEPPPSPHHLVGHEDGPLLARVQDLIDDWDPRKLVNPLVETSQSIGQDGTVLVRKQLRRPDLAQFVADIEAMEALGKAFFWEMQAGSDFRRNADGTYIGTACASCHYKHGADARTRHTRLIPFVTWNKYVLDPAHPLEFGQAQQPYDVRAEAVTQYKPSDYQGDKSQFSLIIGSQGVEPRIFEGFVPDPGGGAWESEKTRMRSVEGFPSLPQWSMFVGGQRDTAGSANLGKRYRQITTRNAPSVINSGFADRLFHDGRAESTFNGFSIFGDADRREVIHKANITVGEDGKEVFRAPIAVRIAITKAALASQAVGPIVNDVEMSYTGRTFPNVAHKLLDATPLKYQDVSDRDSTLGPLRRRRVLASDGTWKSVNYIGKGGTASYRHLIKQAFRREWWDGRKSAAEDTQYEIPLMLLTENRSPDAPVPHGELMVANFPLYWGLSLMFYQASQVSNQTPFDDMLRGRPEQVNARWEAAKQMFGQVKLDRAGQTTRPPHSNGASVFQHGFRTFVAKGCVECHSGPLFSEVYERQPEDATFPIHFLIERVLLPNSRADAIALKYQREREQMLSDVQKLLIASGAVPSDRAEAVARHLDTLREEARSDLATLVNLVRAHLQLGPKASTPFTVARRFIEFERSVTRKFGDRAFFNEDERVALAEALVAPVLVEPMKIPRSQVSTRPRLPIAGPLARNPYAFYDTGFYALGVSPPRYDRGNGDLLEVPNAAEAAIDLVVARLESVENPTPELSKELEKARQYKAAALADRPKIAAEAPALAKDIEQARIRTRRSQSASTPGQAYQFKREWARPKPTRKPGDGPRPTTAAHGSVAAIELGVPKDLDPDQQAKARAGAMDTSWDRTNLPPEVRRADLHFRSRARQLVTTEDPWGYRKPLLHDNELAFWGAFKTPTLRNVELTAPYMHNGRLMTLMDVVDFYDHDEELEKVRFIPRDLSANPDKHPEIVSLNMTIDDKLALVFFLMCLTDDRLRTGQAPFDHPSLRIVHGYSSAGSEIEEDVPMTPVCGN